MPAHVGLVIVRSTIGVAPERAVETARVMRFGDKLRGTRSENIHLIDYNA